MHLRTKAPVLIHRRYAIIIQLQINQCQLSTSTANAAGTNRNKALQYPLSSVPVIQLLGPVGSGRIGSGNQLQWQTMCQYFTSTHGLCLVRRGVSLQRGSTGNSARSLFSSDNRYRGSYFQFFWSTQVSIPLISRSISEVMLLQVWIQGTPSI